MNASDEAPFLIVLGGGGHARVLIDALRAGGERRSIVVLDADPARRGTRVIDALVVGGDDALPAFARGGSALFAVGIGGGISGDTAPRRDLFARAVAHGLAPLTIVHPRAIVSSWAAVEAGAQILAGAVVNAGARIGGNTVVNTAAVVEHDCRVGAHVHVASGACLAGGVTVGDGAHIGAGAAIRQGVTIGAGAVVGIGAAVIADVTAGTVVAGVPAVPLRR